DDEARGADGHGSDDDRCDPPVTDRIGGGAPFELVQVVVHPLARFHYLPFDFTCRSAHSLFSFKLSSVRLGRCTCKRDLPSRIRPRPLTRYDAKQTTVASHVKGPSKSTRVGNEECTARAVSKPPKTMMPAAIAL